MAEPHCRRKKQALKDIEAKKGVAISKAFELGSAEEAIIQRQLGFLPTNVQSVAARAESGTVTSSYRLILAVIHVLFLSVGIIPGSLNRST